MGLVIFNGINYYENKILNLRYLLSWKCLEIRKVLWKNNFKLWELKFLFE